MSAPVPCTPLVTLLHDNDSTKINMSPSSAQLETSRVKNKGDEAWLSQGDLE